MEQVGLRPLKTGGFEPPRHRLRRIVLRTTESGEKVEHGEAGA